MEKHPVFFALIKPMRNLGWIILGVFLFLSVGIYAQYKNDVKPTPTPSPSSVPSFTPSPTLSPTPTITPTPTKQPDAVIAPSGSARVQCGQGNVGTQVTFQQDVANVGLGQKAFITAQVRDTNGQETGGLVEWRLYYRGKLQIDGCNATFIAPDSIGTAYSTSADITARVVHDVTPAPTSAGEGGPINAGFVATTKVTILSGAPPTCYDPEGVSVSINSVDTTRNVQIVIDTPRVVNRVFNGRVATVRDGPGTYYIEYYVDGGLYDATTSQVGKCRLEVIRR